MRFVEEKQGKGGGGGVLGLGVCGGVERGAGGGECAVRWCGGGGHAR